MNRGYLPQSPKWNFPKENIKKKEEIIKEFNLHSVTAQVLLSRGLENVDDINTYFYAKLPRLINPGLFSDMHQAVDRLYSAIKSQENILVYGDNDVDGITGTALLNEFLTSVGAKCFYFIPNRNAVRESILLDALDFAKKKECKLIITVDCGITAASEVEEIVRNNLDVIITDHHEPIAKIPNCVATLNPKLYDSAYPNKDITGVGVAFKLAHALTNHLVARGEMSSKKVDLKKYLDLVALGTVADMGALTGENRIIVRYGLKQLNRTKRVGLLKLLHICDLRPGAITTSDIASKIAPRLNSLGRIADPLKGVELLLIKDPKQAEILAQELDLHNLERQKIEKKDSDDITEFTLLHPELFNDNALVLHSDNWHPGIIPIITARLAKQYNRPTIIITVDEGVGKGSIRTIPEFPILPALRENADLLLNFGGHNFAAGLTIKEENIELFKCRFIEKANKLLSSADVLPKLNLDAKIQFKELTFDFLESLRLLEPFGTDNPIPVFYTEAKQAWPPKIVGKLHLKLYLEQNDRMLEGIAFGMAHRKRELTKKNLTLKVAFSPQINTFLNKSSIQLQIKDFKVSDPLV